MQKLIQLQSKLENTSTEIKLLNYYIQYKATIKHQNQNT